MVLSHAHIDHAGRLPLLVKSGFKGPIFATEPTLELCRIMLADSGRIQEEDAKWKIKRLKKAGKRRLLGHAPLHGGRCLPGPGSVPTR